MKVEIKETGRTKDYPKLMKGSLGTIVLMVRPRNGFVIDCKKDNGTLFDKIGDFHDQWNMDYFKDFEGSITLSND